MPSKSRVSVATMSRTVSPDPTLTNQANNQLLRRRRRRIFTSISDLWREEVDTTMSSFQMNGYYLMSGYMCVFLPFPPLLQLTDGRAHLQERNILLSDIRVVRVPVWEYHPARCRHSAIMGRPHHGVSRRRSTGVGVASQLLGGRLAVPLRRKHRSED